MVNLIQLVAAVGDALVPVNDVARTGVDVAGIHISELTDPTPYLEPGEVLMTTGIPFVDPAMSGGEYVDRLRLRGVSALVIGLGPILQSVPTSIAEHSNRVGMALLVVPAEARFVSVTRSYWGLVAASGRASLVAQLGAQTLLVREAGKVTGAVGIVSQVAKAVGGWAAYVPLNRTGDIVIWPASATGIVPGLRPELRRFADGGNVQAATFPLHGYDVVAHPVGAWPEIRGAFAVGMSRRPSTANKQLILTAAAVLSLREQVDMAATTVVRSHNEAIVDLLLAGEVTAAQAISTTTGGGGSLPATLRVLAITQVDGRSVRRDDPSEIEDVLRELINRGLVSSSAVDRSRPPRASAIDGTTVVLIDAPTSTDEPVQQAAHMNGLAISGALTEPVRLAEIGATALVARRRARSAGTDEVVATERIADLEVGERAADKLATYTRAPLLETARSFLRHRGNWEASARELGVHRNTIRNRVAFIERELGIDLDDPDVCAELWIALRGRS